MATHLFLLMVLFGGFHYVYCAPEDEALLRNDLLLTEELSGNASTDEGKIDPVSVIGINNEPVDVSVETATDGLEESTMQRSDVVISDDTAVHDRNEIVENLQTGGHNPLTAVEKTISVEEYDLIPEKHAQLQKQELEAAGHQDEEELSSPEASLEVDGDRQGLDKLPVEVWEGAENADALEPSIVHKDIQDLTMVSEIESLVQEEPVVYSGSFITLETGAGEEYSTEAAEIILEKEILEEKEEDLMIREDEVVAEVQQVENKTGVVNDGLDVGGVAVEEESVEVRDEAFGDEDLADEALYKTSVVGQGLLPVADAVEAGTAAEKLSELNVVEGTAAEDPLIHDAVQDRTAAEDPSMPDAVEARTAAEEPSMQDAVETSAAAEKASIQDAVEHRTAAELIEDGVDYSTTAEEASMQDAVDDRTDAEEPWIQDAVEFSNRGILSAASRELSFEGPDFPSSDEDIFENSQEEFIDAALPVDFKSPQKADSSEFVEEVVAGDIEILEEDQLLTLPDITSSTIVQYDRPQQLSTIREEVGEKLILDDVWQAYNTTTELSKNIDVEQEGITLAVEDYSMGAGEVEEVKTEVMSAEYYAEEHGSVDIPDSVARAVSTNDSEATDVSAADVDEAFENVLHVQVSAGSRKAETPEVVWMTPLQTTKNISSIRQSLTEEVQMPTVTETGDNYETEEQDKKPIVVDDSAVLQGQAHGSSAVVNKSVADVLSKPIVVDDSVVLERQEHGSTAVVNKPVFVDVAALLTTRDPDGIVLVPNGLLNSDPLQQPDLTFENKVEEDAVASASSRDYLPIVADLAFENKVEEDAVASASSRDYLPILEDNTSSSSSSSNMTILSEYDNTNPLSSSRLYSPTATTYSDFSSNDASLTPVTHGNSAATPSNSFPPPSSRFVQHQSVSPPGVQPLNAPMTSGPFTSTYYSSAPSSSTTHYSDSVTSHSSYPSTASVGYHDQVASSLPVKGSMSAPKSYGEASSQHYEINNITNDEYTLPQSYDPVMPVMDNTSLDRPSKGVSSPLSSSSLSESSTFTNMRNRTSPRGHRHRPRPGVGYKETTIKAWQTNLQRNKPLTRAARHNSIQTLSKPSKIGGGWDLNSSVKHQREEQARLPPRYHNVMPRHLSATSYMIRQEPSLMPSLNNNLHHHIHHHHTHSPSTVVVQRSSNSNHQYSSHKMPSPTGKSFTSAVSGGGLREIIQHDRHDGITMAGLLPSSVHKGGDVGITEARPVSLSHGKFMLGGGKGGIKGTGRLHDRVSGAGSKRSEEGWSKATTGKMMKIVRGGMKTTHQPIVSKSLGSMKMGKGGGVVRANKTKGRKTHSLPKMKRSNVMKRSVHSFTARKLKENILPSELFSAKKTNKTNKRPRRSLSRRDRRRPRRGIVQSATSKTRRLASNVNVGKIRIRNRRGNIGGFRGNHNPVNGSPSREGLYEGGKKSKFPAVRHNRPRTSRRRRKDKAADSVPTVSSQPTVSSLSPTYSQSYTLPNLPSHARRLGVADAIVGGGSLVGGERGGMWTQGGGAVSLGNGPAVTMDLRQHQNGRQREVKSTMRDEQKQVKQTQREQKKGNRGGGVGGGVGSIIKKLEDGRAGVGGAVGGAGGIVKKLQNTEGSLNLLKRNAGGSVGAGGMGSLLGGSFGDDIGAGGMASLLGGSFGSLGDKLLGSGVGDGFPLQLNVGGEQKMIAPESGSRRGGGQGIQGGSQSHTNDVIGYASLDSNAPPPYPVSPHSSFPPHHNGATYTPSYAPVGTSHLPPGHPPPGHLPPGHPPPGPPPPGHPPSTILHYSSPPQHTLQLDKPVLHEVRHTETLAPTGEFIVQRPMPPANRRGSGGRGTHMGSPHSLLDGQSAVIHGNHLAGPPPQQMMMSGEAYHEVRPDLRRSPSEHQTFTLDGPHPIHHQSLPTMHRQLQQQQLRPQHLQQQRAQHQQRQQLHQQVTAAPVTPQQQFVPAPKYAPYQTDYARASAPSAVSPGGGVLQDVLGGPRKIGRRGRKQSPRLAGRRGGSIIRNRRGG
eukprot:GHVQ01018691.1.p1 GENE.GHVQ01018691.1~~GHVQ01018691.1.p1  ORF type:complete len:2006 (+),score=431.33 GHVQ01018691.1:852-6869(+)